jgi:hypothetical protein
MFTAARTSDVTILSHYSPFTIDRELRVDKDLEGGSIGYLPKTVEVAVENTTNEDLYALYSLPNVIRVIKSRRERLAERAARMGHRRGAYRLLVGRPFRRPRHRWEDNIKLIFKKRDVEAWTGLIWPRIGTGDGDI